jgi:hypothetical protein
MINPIVSKINNPVEFPKDVRTAKIKQTPDEIPIPIIEKGFLLILLMMISATIYPAI